MGKSFCGILKEVWEEKKEYYVSYDFYCKKLKEQAEKILKEVKVFVFGSILKGEFTPRSDIDVLIISKNLPENNEERIRIKTELKSSISSFSPFQIHLATPEEYRNWYERFIKDNYKEI